MIVGKLISLAVVIGLIGLFLSLPLSVNAEGPDVLALCKEVFGNDYVNVGHLTLPREWSQENESDPEDNICGVGANSKKCPGLFETVVSSSKTGCCKRVTNETTEYGCMVFDALAAYTYTASTDVAKVDLKVEENLSQLQIDQCKEKDDVKFVPQVTIPGSIMIGGKEIKFVKNEGVTITSSTAAQYFAVFYRFFVAALVIIAIVMVMWGGFKRIMAAGSPERIKSANETIIGAITGVVIALISYSLLSLINPALVSLKSLDAIEPIQCISFAYITDNETSEDIAPSSEPIYVTVIYGDNIINTDGHKADHNMTLDLRLVAARLKDKGIKLVIASGYRTEAKQRELIARNCQNPPGSQTCNPKPGRPSTCILRDGPTSCPHTTGRAVDVWPVVGGTLSITQEQCLANKGACEQNPAMKSLADAMRAYDFCQLCSEPWHFEKKPKMSGCCR